MKKLTSAVVASSLVFGLVGTAFANYSVESVTKAAVRMQTLGLIQGVPTPGGGLDLVLDQKLTRAQLVTVIVRAWGQSETAKLLVGAPSFPDATNHPWASGEIALAKNIAAQNGFTLGYPDGTFKPEGTVTAAEAVALTNKFLGIAPTAGLSWPMGDIQGALDAGIITADDKNTLAALPNIEANRGLAFYLADSAFRTFKLPNGKTVYTTYVDTTPPEVTVDSYTASTDKDSITLTGTAKGQSVLHVGYTGADVVTPKADGTWSANVSLKVGANDIWIHALDVAGNATEVKNVKVTRVAGAAAKVEASLSSALLKAGETADLNVKVSDATGAEIADAVVDVTVEGDIGTYDAATGKFTAATVPADGKLVITSGTVSTEVTAMVVAGDLAKIVISPATVDLQSGTSQKFTVAGEDAHGNTVAVGAATWTASKGVIGADGTFGATSDSTGTVTVTATVGDMSGTATASVFGSAAKVQVAAPEAIVSNSKSETTVTATVLDANGNVARTYNGTVTFASSNTAAATVKTASVTAVNGVASTTIVAGNTAGTTVLSASAAGLTGTTATYTTTAQVATSVAASVSSNSMAAATGSETTVTLKLKDQLGEDMLAAPTGANQITVRLTSSDSTVAFFGTNSATADVIMATVKVDTALKGTSKVGGVTVTGAVTAPTSSTVSVGSVSVNTLVVGSAYQIKVDEITAAKKAGEAVTVTFRVLDFNGNQLTATAGDYATGFKVERITASGTATEITTGSDGATTKGVGTESVTTTATGTFTIKVSGNSLVAGSTSLTVTPGVATSVTLTASPDKLSANGTAQTTLKATVTDVNGNKVTDGSYSVTFKRTAGGTAGLTLADTTVATVNGEASVTITAGTAIGTDNFTVTATGLTTAGASVTTEVQGAPNNLNVGAITGIAAGAEASVPVQVRDASGAPGPFVVTSDNGRTVTVTIKDGTTVVATATGTTVNGVATVKVPGITKAAPALTVEAESTGLTKATNGTLAVAPAAATKIVVTSDRAALSANTASKAMLTVTQYDQYDNKVDNNASAVDAYLQVTSGGAYGSLEGTAEVAGDWVGWHKVTIPANTASVKTVDGTNSLVATTAAGTAVVTARSGSLTESTLSISTVVTGQASALNVSAPSDTVASLGAGGDVTQGKYQEITVTLVDGNGSAITHENTVQVTLTDPAPTGTNFLRVKNAAGTWIDYTAGTGKALIKGQLTFGLINTKAESLDYVFTAPGPITKTATGKFVAGEATSVAVDTSTPAKITGDGIGLTTVSARVTDANGNTVTTAGGTMTFAIETGNDYATLQALTAPIVNGVASIVAQSKVLPAGIDTGVKVKASSDLNADGSITGTEEDIPTASTFTVDSVKPTVNSVVATGYAAADTITITFSEAMTQSTLSAASLSVVSNNSFGGAGAKVEFTGATTLVITLGAGPTVVAGDVIKAVSATTLTDVAGNGFGTANLVIVP